MRFKFLFIGIAIIILIIGIIFTFVFLTVSFSVLNGDETYNSNINNIMSFIHYTSNSNEKLALLIESEKRISGEPRPVSYNVPNDTYQKSVNELSRYANVSEGDTGNSSTLGYTQWTYYGYTSTYDVIIAYRDPFVVYHEMAHVLNSSWNESLCNEFAYNKTGYYIAGVEM
ncbi:MAG: hypothetical protein ACRC1M_05565 [Methanobacteriaceae archaeon]